MPRFFNGDKFLLKVSAMVGLRGMLLQSYENATSYNLKNSLILPAQ